MAQNSGARRYHIVLSRPFDLAAFDARAAADQSPRHTMSLLQKALEAGVHEPDDAAASVLDRVKAKVPGIGTAGQWAIGRAAPRLFGVEDVVFAIGEDGGLPIALAYGTRQPRPRLAVFMQHPGSRRVRLLFRRYDMSRRIDQFFTNTDYKERLLIEEFGLDAAKIYRTEEQTDTDFFRPEPAAKKSRPLIASGGLEKRDYVTLGQATADMDLDVKICAMSPNALATPGMFHEPLPANMAVGRYEWPELRQLYNDADIVVLSMQDNIYQAGLTTLMEAMACRRPVIMTRTEGLAARFADLGLITPVPPADPGAMRAAVEGLLADPEAAAAQAERGYRTVTEQHTAERYIGELTRHLSAL